MRCFFPSTEHENGLVISIDHDGGPSDDKFLMKVRAQFAKSIGVYYDIRTKGSAFPGPEDIFSSCSLSFDEYVIEKKEKEYSAFPHRHHFENAGKQKDNYNCGIIALKSSIKCMSQKYYKLRQNIITTKECNNSRRALLEFISDFIQEVNPKWNDDDEFPGQHHKPCTYKENPSLIITKTISDEDSLDEDNNEIEKESTQNNQEPDVSGKDTSLSEGSSPTSTRDMEVGQEEATLGEIDTPANISTEDNEETAVTEVMEATNVVTQSQEERSVIDSGRENEEVSQSQEKLTITQADESVHASTTNNEAVNTCREEATQGEHASPTNIETDINEKTTDTEDMEATNVVKQSQTNGPEIVSRKENELVTQGQEIMSSTHAEESVHASKTDNEAVNIVREEVTLGEDASATNIYTDDNEKKTDDAIPPDTNDVTNQSEICGEEEWSDTENEVVGRGHYFQSESHFSKNRDGKIQDIPSVLEDKAMSQLGPGIVKKNPNKSILNQLLKLFCESYFVHEEEIDQSVSYKNSSFLAKMKQYDTYYMSKVVNRTSTHKLICAAIIEVGNMNQRKYKYEETIDETGKKTYDSQVCGYKSTSKFILLHNIATPYENRGNGYAKALVECIARYHYGKQVHMYWYKDKNESGNFYTKDYSSEDFLKSIGFQTDPKGMNYRLMLVDNENLSETPFIDDSKELYRNSTNNLRALNKMAVMEDSIQYLELAKNSFLKIIFMQKVDRCEDLDFIINNIAKRVVLDVSKNIRQHYSLLGETESKRRKGENSMDESIVDKTDYTLYGYNAFFGWRIVDEILIPIALVRMAKQNADKVLSIPAGNRTSSNYPRVRTIHDVNTENICLPTIKHMFRTKSRTDSNYGACQWISAAMLIDISDNDTSRNMISHLKTDTSSFLWKAMYKGNNSLSTVIRKKTKYNLVKVKLNVRNYIPFLHSVQRGRYVCVLQDNNYGQNHVVGIDCESIPKLIWDCAERNALLFTQQNLDRCVDHGKICIAIKCIGEIKRK